MSTDHGLPKQVEDAVRDLRRQLVHDARGFQVDFLEEPATSDEILEAREILGVGAGALAVAREVKAIRRGRPKNARNRRTNDLVAYFSQFGPDPGVVAMRIMAETEEALVERSRLVDPTKKQLGIGDARAMRLRAAELMIPYFHGKKPIQIQLDATGDFNLVIPGINVSQEDADRLTAGTFVLEADYEDIGEDGDVA